MYKLCVIVYNTKRKCYVENVMKSLELNNYDLDLVYKVEDLLSAFQKVNELESTKYNTLNTLYCIVDAKKSFFVNSSSDLINEYIEYTKSMNNEEIIISTPDNKNFIGTAHALSNINNAEIIINSNIFEFINSLDCYMRCVPSLEKKIYNKLTGKNPIILVFGDNANKDSYNYLLSITYPELKEIKTRSSAARYSIAIILFLLLILFISTIVYYLSNIGKKKEDKTKTRIINNK